jgi:hypothetical protein
MLESNPSWSLTGCRVSQDRSMSVVNGEEPKQPFESIDNLSIHAD